MEIFILNHLRGSWPRVEVKLFQLKERKVDLQSKQISKMKLQAKK